MSKAPKAFMRWLSRFRAAAIEIRNAMRYVAFGEARLSVAHAINMMPGVSDSKRLWGGSPDPQIYFAGVPRLGLSRPATFLIRLELLSDSQLERPVLYLRRHRAFDEADQVAVSEVGGGLWAAQIDDTVGLDGLRFDPSEGACDIRIGEIVVRHTSKFLASVEVPIGTTATEPPHVESRPAALLAIAELIEFDDARLIGAEGVSASRDTDVLIMEGGDPQLIFALEPGAYAGNALLTQLSFVIDMEASAPLAARIYLDYGDGFSQAHSFPLDSCPDGCAVIIALPQLVKRIRWDPTGCAGVLRLRKIVAHPQELSALVENDDRPGSAWTNGAVRLSLDINERYINAGAALAYDYTRWTERFATPAPADYDSMRAQIMGFAKCPTFSFVMPVYNTSVPMLEDCVRSMQAQIYPHFEICIADDCSPNRAVIDMIERMAELDPRIRWVARAENGHISRASNSALALATGDYVVLIDHDDLVPDFALFAVAAVLQDRPDARILYSDEDKLNPDGKRCDPYFKGEFNDFLMFGHNMISHLGVYARSLVADVGGFRPGYEGSQDYDLFLRCSERCAPGEIVHIPHVLYHWRMIPGSTAMAADQKDYAIVAARLALNDAFARRGLPLRSIDGVAPGLTAVEVLEPTEIMTVSIVIPTRDGLDVLVACLASLEPLDPHTEIIIVDNNSTDPETLAFLAAAGQQPNVKLIDAPGPFNFSTLCNLGVDAAGGDIICLLNNDTELLSPGWLSRARGLLSIPSVGAVGARLLYPDGSLQHFGLVLGMGAHGIAGTPHRGIPSDDFGYFGKARLLQEFSAVTAACLFVRKADYLAVGGFDPALAVAYNDVDFCLKLRSRGLKVLADPEIVLTHKESKTRGSDTDPVRAARLAGEGRLMHSRWGPVLKSDPYYSPNLTLARDDFSLAETPHMPCVWAKWPQIGNAP